MHPVVTEPANQPEPVRIEQPVGPPIPVVLVSPHSGRAFPPRFRGAVRLDEKALRRSEDCFVDEIFSGGPGVGAPLISATFARAFLDVNREAFELDPAMFDGPLPAYVNCRSPRVKAGLGTIARVVSRGQEIYGKKLEFSEALERVRDYYVPFHEAVQSTINTTQSAFGACILIDCHSMPSIGLGRLANSANLADFVLGDCYGSACASPVMDEAEAWLVKTGYRVARNSPYAGGFTTRHYGRPTKGVHALQIEINRALYMNETTLRKKPSFQRLQRDMETLVARLGRLDLNGLRAA